MKRVAAAIVFALVLGGSTVASAAPTGYSSITGTSDRNLYAIDLATGVATAVGEFGPDEIAFYGFAFSPSGVLHGIGSSGEGQALYTLSTSTGAATLVGPTGVVDGSGLAFTPDGRLWMTDFSATQTLYELNPATGAATAVATGALGADIEGLGADCGGLYGIGDGDYPYTYRIDTATGTATPLPDSYNPPVLLIDNAGLDFDGSGVLWGIESEGEKDAGSTVFTVDPTTGAATVVADVTISGERERGFRGLAIVAPGPCSVPTPPVELEPAFTG